MSWRAAPSSSASTSSGSHPGFRRKQRRDRTDARSMVLVGAVAPFDESREKHESIPRSALSGGSSARDESAEEARAVPQEGLLA